MNSIIFRKLNGSCGIVFFLFSQKIQHLIPSQPDVYSYSAGGVFLCTFTKCISVVRSVRDTERAREHVWECTCVFAAHINKGVSSHWTDEFVVVPMLHVRFELTEGRRGDVVGAKQKQKHYWRENSASIKCAESFPSASITMWSAFPLQGLNPRKLANTCIKSRS